MGILAIKFYTQYHTPVKSHQSLNVGVFIIQLEAATNNDYKWSLHPKYNKVIISIITYLLFMNHLIGSLNPIVLNGSAWMAHSICGHSSDNQYMGQYNSIYQITSFT